MRTRIAVAVLLTVGALYDRPGRSQTAPTVRIGLTQNASTVSIRSSDAFTIQKNRTRTAKFTMILTVDPTIPNGVLTRNDLQYRALVEIDGGGILVIPKSTKVRVEPAGSAPI